MSTKLQKNRGTSGVKQRGRTSLAVELQNAFPPELHRDWYRTILSGKWPLLVEDARCALGWKIMEHPTKEPTTDQMAYAFYQLENREFGQAPQMMHIKEEVEAHVKVSVELPEVKTLTLEQKEKMREALGIKHTYNLPEPSDEFEDMNVSDADFAMLPVVKGSGND